ncbi:DUF4429 domain-containing protein [Allosalinactinospora lopnorensis]|uniref:DUF4429 domain-containing protein n=1 Tax=Allosalinactinospora lopnorensis TaxID=1352348 RepID=UPI000623E135|nr:DUF4429 domain-containing protein [Allosalinactinospora lopnorensis]
MDELQGDQGAWRFDGRTVLVRYHTRRGTPALLRALGECRVPMDAVRAVEFQRGDRKAGWRLRLRLVEGADPYSAVTAFPDDDSDPFSLTGPADSELIAEYFSEQIGLAVPDGEADSEGRADPAEAARGLVLRLPLRIRTAEGSASFDGRTVRLRWDGVLAGSAKGHERTRDFAAEDIAKVEWEPQIGLEVGFLRLVVRGRPAERPADPEEDLTCLCSHGGKGQAHTFMMAAAITAYLRPGGGTEPPAVTAANAGDDGRLVYDRIRELGRLHKEGLLTDEEFTFKKTELLRRL